MKNDSFLEDYLSKSEIGRPQEQSKVSTSSCHNAYQFDDAHPFVIRDVAQNRKAGIYSIIVVAFFLGIVVFFCVRHSQKTQSRRIALRLSNQTQSLASEEECVVVTNVGTQYSTVSPEKPEECFQRGLDYTTKENYVEAVKWYRKAANCGYADAQFRLGSCYAFGEGVEQSWETAVYWAGLAAKQGHKDALYNLAGCYEDGNGVTQSFQDAAKMYYEAAEQGHARAQFCLGRFYAKGIGVSQSWPEAVKWYRKAAEQGVADAQYNLAMCYENGTGVVINYRLAVKWYYKAAEQGNENAISRLNQAKKNSRDDLYFHLSLY